MAKKHGGKKPNDTKAAKADRALRRVGQSCITVFVVFLLTLFAFGAAPVTRSSSESGWGMNADGLSCLGILMGAYSLLFLLPRIRLVLKTPATTRAMGLGGALGLIAHSVIALAALFPTGANSSPPVATDLSGPEQWSVDGKQYQINRTYLLPVDGTLQYTIEHPRAFGVLESNMTRTRVLDIVFPLVEHAYTNDLHKHMSVHKLGGGKMAVAQFCVIVGQNFSGEFKGYRILLSLDEIRARIKQIQSSAAPGPTPSAG